MKSLDNDATIIAGEEILSESAKSDERIMLGIRLREGLARNELNDIQEEVVAKYIASQAIDQSSWDKGRLTLTLKGRLIADRIVRDLVV